MTLPAGTWRRCLEALRSKPIPFGVGAIFFAQIYFFQWHPGYPNPNEVIRIYLARAIVEDGSLAVDAQIRRFGDVEDKAVARGRTFCDKAPGMSFLAVPVLGIARLFGDPDLKTARHLCWIALVALPSLLLLLALWRFLERFELGEPARALVLVAFGLGSLQFTFTTLLFSHATAAVLTMTAFFAACAYRRGHAGRGVLAWGGLAAGFAAITEYPTAIPLFFIFVYVCASRSWRGAWAFAIPALVPIALWMIYNDAAFGQPIAFGYKHLANPFFSGVHAKGLLGVTSPTWEAFRGSFFSPSRGLFAFAPWLVLAVPGLVLLFARRGWRAEALVVAASFLGYGYFISSFGYWVGGGSVGQRHLTPLVPLLLLPFAEVVRRVATLRTLRLSTEAMLRALVLVGVVVTVVSSIPWPFASPGYTNPLAQIELQMWRDAILPASLGEALGLPVEWAAIVFIVWVGAIALWAIAQVEGVSGHARVVVTSAAIALAAGGLAWHSRQAHAPGLEARHTRDRAGITKLVDPGARRPAAREIAALQSLERAGRLDASGLRRLAELLALRGDTLDAWAHYRAAASRQAPARDSTSR
jgi:hypothetical protein